MSNHKFEIGCLSRGPHLIEKFDGDILVFKHGEEILACLATCPHKGASLETGVVEGGKLHCPLHEAAFDLKTGEGSEPWAGWLQMYPVSVEDGFVTVDDS